MEDVDLMRRIKRAGGKIVFINDAVQTSARRWDRDGIIFGTFRNWVLVMLFIFGISPSKLVRFYSRTS